MRVIVEVYGRLRELMGWRKTEVHLPEDSTLNDLIDLLITQRPELQDELFEGHSLKSYVKVLINGRDCRFFQELSTKLEDGHVVSIFPPSGGG